MQGPKICWDDVVKYSGYNMLDYLYKWTGQTLITLPPDHCPTNHFDSIGWFDLYRLQAAEKFVIPNSSSPRNKNVFSLDDPRVKYEHGVNVDKEIWLEQYGGMGDGPYIPYALLNGNTEVADAEVAIGENIRPLPLQNPIFPQFKGFVDVKLNFRNGRTVFANELIPTGRVLAVDPAYAVLAMNKGLHKVADPPKTTKVKIPRTCYCCSYCLKLISPDQALALACTGCSEMIYCSTTCRDKANAEFHKFECGAFEGLGLDLNKRCHQELVLTYRALCRLGPLEAYELFGGDDPDNAFNIYHHDHMDCNSPREFIHGCTYGAFDSRYINAVRSMGYAGNFADMLRKNFCNVTALDANIVVRILEERTNFFELSEAFDCQEYKSTIGGLAFQILLGLKEKMVYMTTVEACVDLSGKGQGQPQPWRRKGKVSEVKTPLPLPVEHVTGVGIFPSISNFTHACFPNAFLEFDGRNCYAIASRPIGPGEEITINWFPPSEKEKTEVNSGCMDSESRATLLQVIGMDPGQGCDCWFCAKGEKMDQIPTGLPCLTPLCKEITSISFDMEIEKERCRDLMFTFFGGDDELGLSLDDTSASDVITKIVESYEREKKLYADGYYSNMTTLATKSAIRDLWAAKAFDSKLTLKLDVLLKNIIRAKKPYKSGDC